MPYVAPELTLVGDASDVVRQKALNPSEEMDSDRSGWALAETEW